MSGRMDGHVPSSVCCSDSERLGRAVAAMTRIYPGAFRVAVGNASGRPGNGL